MIKNILVGYDESRPAQVALAQAIDLAEASSGRVHLLVVTSDEEEAAPQPGLAGEPEILEMVDRGLEEPADDQEPPAPPFVAEARHELASSSVAGAIRVVRGGRPADRLREEANLVDLLVVGRGRVRHGWQAGRNTEALLKRPLPCSLLVCADEYQQIASLLLVYYPAQAAGRALSCAGQLASDLNIPLDVVVSSHGRRATKRQRERVESALLAYHTEGEVVASAEAPEEAALSEGLERNPTALVVPQPSLPRWPWQLSLLYSAALELPDTLLFIIP